VHIAAGLVRNMLKTTSLAFVLLAATPVLAQKAPAPSSTHQASTQQTSSDTRPTAPFRAEHAEVQEHLRHVHEWAGQLAKQKPAEQKKTAQQIVSFFEGHIIPHAQWEEQNLYPIVDKLAGGGPNRFTSTMRHEHEIVGRWTAELRAEAAKPKLDTAKFSRRTDNLLGLLWAHFEEEEQVLLPFIDKGMTPEQFKRELDKTSGKASTKTETKAGTKPAIKTDAKPAPGGGHDHAH